MQPLDAGLILEGVEGRKVGRPDGVIICDYCGARVDADESQTWQAYLTSPKGQVQPIFVMHVYCPDCDKTENFPSTDGVDEIVITFTPRTELGTARLDPGEVLLRRKP